ncbi:uncharacterized protein LOC112468549 [Temnothorax curvispinosus]|uniref:Uncharacterized protein LOC112468549 n=1 Tax=Temnothorax curvispinosus TaxID=300111 RepID=A0A6J1RLL0_9HYME|nr:uncharacterized protein LOC112468549 [Temnothorax curvispinosus]
MNDNVFCEKSVSTGKMHTDDDVAKWSIVHFETDEDEDIESFNDLIPSSWITTTGTLCWYPMTEHQATVQKLVKQCAKANSEWNCFAIKTIEEDIGKYDQKMKMLVKFSKNPNATLYSDFEEKGKRKRLREPIKYFDDKSDNDKKKINTKRRNIQSIPPLPKLANASNSAQASEPVKVNKMIKSSCVDKASSSDNNVKKPKLLCHT